MDQHWYCSRCAAHLPQGGSTMKCPHCKTGFDKPGAVYAPMADPDSAWVARRILEREHRPTIGSALASLVLRLIGGAVVVAILGVVTLFSAIPYGGGNKSFISLFQLAIISVLIWALWPLGRVITGAMSKPEPPPARHKRPR